MPAVNGYADQKKTGDMQYATVATVREGQNAQDVIAHLYMQSLGSDAAETGSTSRIIKATAHVAIRGDVISWTSGNLDTREYRVLSTETDYITVVEEMSEAPANGDTFKVLRQKAPTVNADGEITVGVTFDNDTNYGAVGDDTLRTAAQIGNATGAADFDEGVVGAQTLRVSIATDDDAVAHLAAIETATEATQAAVEGTLDVSVSASVLPTGAATEATLATLAAEDFATETTLAALAAEDFATETTLAALSAKVANNYGAAAGAVRTAAQVGNASGIADFGAGAATSATLRAAVATTNIAYAPAFGEIAGASLTGSYATLLNPSSDLKVLYFFNDCNNTILVSLDGGSTDHFKLTAGESFVLDLASNGLKFDNAVNISAKHAGAAPTAGSIRASGVG